MVDQPSISFTFAVEQAKLMRAGSADHFFKNCSKTVFHFSSDFSKWCEKRTLSLQGAFLILFTGMSEGDAYEKLFKAWEEDKVDSLRWNKTSLVFYF